MLIRWMGRKSRMVQIKTDWIAKEGQRMNEAGWDQLKSGKMTKCQFHEKIVQNGRIKSVWPFQLGPRPITRLKRYRKTSLVSKEMHSLGTVHKKWHWAPN